MGGGDPLGPLAGDLGLGRLSGPRPERPDACLPLGGDGGELLGALLGDRGELPLAPRTDLLDEALERHARVARKA